MRYLLSFILILIIASVFLLFSFDCLVYWQFDVFTSDKNEWFYFNIIKPTIDMMNTGCNDGDMWCKTLTLIGESVRQFTIVLIFGFIVGIYDLMKNHNWRGSNDGLTNHKLWTKRKS